MIMFGILKKNAFLKKAIKKNIQCEQNNLSLRKTELDSRFQCVHACRVHSHPVRGAAARVQQAACILPSDRSLTIATKTQRLTHSVRLGSQDQPGWVDLGHFLPGTGSASTARVSRLTHSNNLTTPLAQGSVLRTRFWPHTKAPHDPPKKKP